MHKRLGQLAGHFIMNAPRARSVQFSTMAGESSATDVLVRRSQNMRVFVLNRPKALNALTLNMIQLMTPQLQVWNESDLCKVILLMGAEGSKGFCAGGDVKEIVTKAKSKKAQDLADATKFFEQEYHLNHLIGTLKKPFISLMNGITMGGGVGLSVHAPFRIVTENTVFAMPETGIGLFPDVGGSFFLPRLDGELGTYLGLTGAKLKGEEVFFAGVGTHFVPSERIPALLARLSDIETNEIQVINMAIEEYVGDSSLEKWRNWSLGGKVAGAIDRCFKFDTLEEIISALRAENSEWATKTLETLQTMSPNSLKVTLMQLRKGRKLDFASCFQMEYNMVQEFLRTPDFLEGVTAKLIEKRDPQWSPSWDRLDALRPSLLEDSYFYMAPLSSSSRAPDSRHPKQRLEFLNDLTYFEYPHKTFSGLPTDRDIERVMAGKVKRSITQGQITKDQEILNHHWGGYDKALIGNDITKLPNTITIENGFGRGKTGLAEKVMAYLERKRESKL